MAHMLLAFPIRLAGWLLADKGAYSPELMIVISIFLPEWLHRLSDRE